jgi:glycosyltransferase involved in cell wall biosynthesis
VNLYVTGDAIGTATGGGKVTRNEAQALSACGETEVWQFPNDLRPWGPDFAAAARLAARPDFRPEHAHFYSGTFTRTIVELLDRGTIVSYTAAAHDIAVSRREHELLGLPFDYPHLVDPAQWREYLRGYLLADVVVCPSAYSAQVMRRYGCERVRVIPHGYDPPGRIAPIPSRFVVGYLGQPGPDKGLVYLIRAWDAWCRDRAGPARDALLVIAGRGTMPLIPAWVRELCTHGSYYVQGEVREPRDLYDACCLYIQPSVSEGFGCEVVEARAHGRPVVCSDGAGARDHATQVVPACDVGSLASAIDDWYGKWLVDPQGDPQGFIALADPGAISHLTWDRVRDQYVALFRDPSVSAYRSAT